ncbi:pyridoxal-phosphate dependent enzyme [Asanoa sp. NPDC049573]|uniref:threonine ammonia-lyase n=1 Tax=Asanoa sp. NPDC049573 TaxID=3155396 RepID=UPI0034414247
MPPPPSEPSLEDAYEAATALAPHIVRTPVLGSRDLDARLGVSVRAKAESLQITGSFKVRGALNRIRTLDQAERDRGLITVSAGNAALGAAYAAQLHGCALTVVMAESAVREKRAAAAALGATVVTEGVRDAAAAFALARRLVAERGLTFIHPFDDPMVVAGAATATLELLAECPDITRLYVPCSGGGLLAGAAIATRAIAGHVELVAVQPLGTATLAASLEAGRPVSHRGTGTIVDALTAPMPGELNLRIISSASPGIRTVTDEATLAAMADVARDLRLIVEPAGAIAVAGVKADVADGRADGPVGVLLSGSNASWSLLTDVLRDSRPR